MIKNFLWILNSFIIISIMSFPNMMIKSMGEGFNKLIYIHVPVAWLSSLIYLIIGILSIIYLIRKDPKLMRWMKEIAIIGVTMSFTTLVTGSFWGKHTWGTYWVWEGRLTGILAIFIILMILIYLIKGGYHEKACYINILGLMNIPLIKYSVDWWTGLHQKSSVSLFSVSQGIEETTGLPIIMISITMILISCRIFWVKQRKEELDKYQAGL